MPFSSRSALRFFNVANILKKDNTAINTHKHETKTTMILLSVGAGGGDGVGRGGEVVLGAKVEATVVDDG
jgi:hypothetical protein